MHSSASATSGGVVLHTQYFATAVAIRLSDVVALVHGSREPQRGRCRRLGVEAEVGEHVLLERLLDEQPAEDGTVRRVMRRFGDSAALQGRRTEHAVESGERDGLDDRCDAAALVTDARRPRAAKLDLRGCVGAVAELVLEALQTERVACAVVQHARHEEARQASGRVRQHQERVAHRRRAEPLAALQGVAAVGERLCSGLVRAHVRATLPLRQRHAGERAGLRSRRAEPRLVCA